MRAVRKEQAIIPYMAAGTLASTICNDVTAPGSSLIVVRCKMFPEDAEENMVVSPLGDGTYADRAHDVDSGIFEVTIDAWGRARTKSGVGVNRKGVITREVDNGAGPLGRVQQNGVEGFCNIMDSSLCAWRKMPC